MTAVRAMTVATGALALTVVGVAGYYANEWRVCRGMEDDYLRLVSGFTANVQARALSGAAGLDANELSQHNLREIGLRLQKLQLARIYERCGVDAGEAVVRKSQETLSEI